MNIWIIVSALLALACGGMAAFCRRQRLSQRKAREDDAEARARELDRLRADNVRCRRETASARRALEREQDRGDALEDALRDRERRLHEAEDRLTMAEHRRIEMEDRLTRAERGRVEAEKDAAAGRMRSGLLEGQLRRATQESAAQERLYQDILKEREETIAKLQERQTRRALKRTAVSPEQITLNDLLEGLTDDAARSKSLSEND